MSIYRDTIDVGRPSFLEKNGIYRWNCTNLTDLTIIFGKNGSGKSQLLRKIAGTDADNIHYVSPERSGQLNYRLDTANEQLNPSNRYNKRLQNLSDNFRSEAVSRIISLMLEIGNKSMEKSETNVYKDDIVNLLSELLSDFTFEIINTNDPLRIKRRENESEVGKVENLSSGETELISIALDVITICYIWRLNNDDVNLLLIDEPDMHLHPELQQQLARFFIHIIDKFSIQILLATHSTTMLSSLGHFGRDKVSLILLDNSIQDQIAKPFDDALLEITTILGGHALMGPLFGAPLLLVEGDDDYRIWSQVPRHPENNNLFSVIPCGGEEIINYSKALDKIFKSLRQSVDGYSVYALLNGDKAKPGNLDFVQYLRLEAHESENLYLTDEVLAYVGLDWEEAKIRIKENADQHGNKEVFLLTCDDWDRKNVDIKDYINEISKCIDDKNVVWSMRVGRCIGRKKPEGQLADFLGDDIINTFWNDR